MGAQLPPHVATAMENFHNGLTEEEQSDPQFRYRVAFVPKLSGKATKADLAVEFVKPGSPEAASVERVLLKETERNKFRPTEIVTKANAAGYPNFKIYDHTQLVDQLDARNLASDDGLEMCLGSV